MTGSVQPRVEVLVRADCHLCETALAVITQVCAETGNAWTSTDIDSRPDLLEQYTEQVPVTFVDGTQHDFWRVDPNRLRAALTS